jgi:hypothetical protein
MGFSRSRACFFRVEAGSGLVIQCLARRQETPRRWMARRMVSMLSRRGVQPWAWQTWATKASVQVLRGWPNTRGVWCNRCRKESSKVPSNTGRALWGRDDFSVRQASPSAAKAWMALRAERGVQPRLRAMSAGVWPAALARRIWQRRKVKASVERSP